MMTPAHPSLLATFPAEKSSTKRSPTMPDARFAAAAAASFRTLAIAALLATGAVNPALAKGPASSKLWLNPRSCNRFLCTGTGTSKGDSAPPPPPNNG